MTIAEFKAWLEGFEAAIGDAPTAEQWAAIKAKLWKLRAIDVHPPRDRPSIGQPWLEVNPHVVRYTDDRTVPLGAH